MKKNLYDVLELSQHASVEAIEAAYQRLSEKFSPDRVGNAAIPDADFHYKLVKEAYATLSIPDRRLFYNLTLQERLLPSAESFEEDAPYWSFSKFTTFALMLFSLVAIGLYLNHKSALEKTRIEEEKVRAAERIFTKQQEEQQAVREQTMSTQATREARQQEDRARAETAQALTSQDYAMRQRNAQEEQARQRAENEARRREQEEQRELQNRARQEQLSRERQLREFDAERRRR